MVIAALAAASWSAPGSTAEALEAAPRFFTIAQVLEPASHARPAGVTQDLRLATDHGKIGKAVIFSERGYGLFPSVHGALEPRWYAVLAKWRGEEKEALECIARSPSCANARAQAFATLVLEARGRSGLDRLKMVNGQVNAAIRYRTDIRNYGVPDYWASPFETLAGYGDCEDYAILKLFVLLQAGVPAEDMAIVLLRDEAVGEDHAVLAVQTAQGWRLLDNRWNRLDDPEAAKSYLPRFRVTLQRIEMFAEPFEAVSLRPAFVAHATPGSGRP